MPSKVKHVDKQVCFATCKASWNAAGAGLFQGRCQRHPARTLDCCYVDGNVQPHQRQVSGSQRQQECILVGCILPAAIAVFPATHTPSCHTCPSATHAPPSCHACPLPRSPPTMHVPGYTHLALLHTPCYACHPATHAPSPCHACPPPWTEFLTKACENITLPQPRCGQ